MKRKVLAGSALALFAAVPAIVAPQLTSVAHAQTAVAEYPDVPRGHWAYEAINKLSQAGIIEGLPNGNYYGNKPMTRYEFAVAIARLLERIGPGLQGPKGDTGDTGPAGPAGATGATGPAGTGGGPAADITRAEVNDLIGALRREFSDELARLGVRVDAVEGRLTNLENRVAKPPRMTITPSLLHRTGTATYISQVTPSGPGGIPAPNVQPGRNVVNGNGFTTLGQPQPSGQPYTYFPKQAERLANEKYSYTDFELRLTDRVTDRLSVVGALRSLSGTQEDAWAGDNFGEVQVREAYAVADLSDRSFIGIKGLNVILGRQPTKIAQGLLYDNDLSPTDQLRADFGLGPMQLSAFIGSNNNNNSTSFNNPYLDTGAVRYLGTPTNAAAAANFFPGNPFAANSGAITGFANQPNQAYVDDNEAAARIGFNLFRLAGQPVSVGVTRLFDGVQNQQGDSIDLTIPLFNRTIGVEYVRQRNYSDLQAPTKPTAYNITVPLLRTRILDANFAYGKAANDFEYFTSSSANPFARTYAEALFDRPMALGAPMINGRAFGPGGAVVAGQPINAAAKKVYDFTGTLRLIRRLPLEFRYYKAYGTQLAPGGQDNALDLGAVYTIGSTFNVSPGLDLEVKYGHYGVYGPLDSIQYVRVGANVGF